MEFGFLILLVLFYVLGLPVLVFSLWTRLRNTETRVADLEHTLRYGHLPAGAGADDRVPEPAAEIEPETKIQPPSAEEPGEPQGHVAASIEEPVPAVAYSAPEEAVATAPEKPAPDDGPEDTPEFGRFSLSNFDFEDLVGRRGAIWLGGITLAISGILAVRYSIQQGLLTPQVRVFLSFLFGAVMLGGAEFAFRNEDRVKDERVAQALAGAGLATLYAAFYLAGTQYGLIGPTLAFVGLATVTAGAIALSYRFGMPAAILGLVGGFAAPALVGSEEANIPLLALYLGLVTGGLCFTGRAQKRMWMGIAALIGGLGWGALLLLGDGFTTTDILALGAYLIVLGAVLPTLVEHDAIARPLRAAAAFLASLQLAILVAQAGHAPLAWALYLLMGGTLAWFALQREDMRIASPVAALIGLMLLMLWVEPDPTRFALVAAGLAAVFVGVPLALMWQKRDGLIEWLMVGLIPPALATLAYIAFGFFEADRIESNLALGTVALAALPGIGAWQMRDREQAGIFAGLVGVAIAMLFAAGLMVTPGWSAPLVAAFVLTIPMVLLAQRQQLAVTVVLWIGAGAAFIALLATANFFEEVQRLALVEDQPDLLRAILRWGAATLPMLALCWFEKREHGRRAAEIAAAALGYGLVAQALPSTALPWATALAAIALWYTMKPRMGAYATLTIIAVAWAFLPLGAWLVEAIESLAGDPILVFNLPTLRELALRVVPAALALAVIRYRSEDSGPEIPAHWLALPLGLMVVHVLYRQLFDIQTMTEFVTYGMAERTVWQALLVGAAWLAASGVPRLGASTKLAIALATASLLHFAAYSLWWHNPMTADQAVGSTPIANLFLAAYAVAIVGCLMLRRWSLDIIRPAIDGLVMFLATLGALALLRQIFGGSTPFDLPMTQNEDLLRSLIGIVMALLFLWIGSRLNQRSWRVGSLIVMLIAVFKVFLFDASGLEGLLQIASFAALGLSLIGLGWFYTRQLKASVAT